jgi:glutamate/tyrosine decarboxylase-like PLP-dependent enzyme
MDQEAVLGHLSDLKAADLDWKSGRAYAYVYDAGSDIEETGRRAFGDYLFQNALDPTAFPSVLAIENDLVAIGARHLGGDDETAGTFTSGGTESIMLAVKAARDQARTLRPGITAPEMVLPVTGHAAFHKAADYLGLKVVPTDIDPVTMAADPRAVEAAITENTIMIVGSAPSYAHGVIDPIPELAVIAEARGIWLHVDACVGGWLLPFCRRLSETHPALDFTGPSFDFRVPGVTSMSVDLHKYAFTPKGASVVLYRNRELRRFQFFTCTQWTGYSVINTTVQSSRSGGPLAAAWAVLHRIGDAGYLDLARRTLEGTRRLVQGIEEIDGLSVLGRPDFCMVAAASREVSVFHIVDAMAARGWYVQPQLAFAQSPESIHISLSPKNAEQVEPLLAALRESVEEARKLPSGELGAMVQGALAGLDPAAIAGSFPELLGLAGIEGERLPERMAGVNELLNALPRELCKELLTEFVGRMFTATPNRKPSMDRTPVGSTAP